MPNNQNLIQFKKGESGNLKGRPKGVKNRGTIIRDIFNSITQLDSFQFNDLKSKFPNIKEEISIEYLMTLIQVDKAIFKGDTKAYKVLMDSIYGTPIRQLDLEIRNKELEIEEQNNQPEQFDISELSVLELRILLKAFNGSEEDKEELRKEYEELNKS
tara:strand:- start:55 stop:528 length:474 start_codon:yes stop_codon:yes gene_type:complete